MRMTIRAALLATTALVAFAGPAMADPVTMLVAAGTAFAGGTVSAIVAGGAIAWGAIAAQAVVAGVLAGVAASMQPKMSAPAPSAQEMTLNRITPLTSGLILYGERIVGGTIVARSTTAVGGKPHARYHSIIPLACHQIDGAQAMWLGETKVWSKAQYDIDAAENALPAYHWGQIESDYRYKFLLKVYNGTTTQSAESRYVSAADEWTSTAQGKGIAYVYFEADFDQNIFPRGVEQIRVLCRGKRVHDPRDGLTKYTKNPFLCLRDYVLTAETFGGIGWSVADINDAAIIAQANIADETIALGNGDTEARYEFNGILDTASSPESNLDRLSTSWGGWWTVDKGLLTVGGGAYEAATFTITEDMMAGPIKVKARRPFEEQFNTIKAVYADPDAEYVPTDLPVLDSATYQAADNGEELIRDLGELPGETGYARAQRLMKLALLKGRRQRMVDVPCTLAAWSVGLGDNVKVTVDRRGWSEKTFEVVGRAVSIAPGNVQVSLSLIESGPAVFDWTTSEETAKPAGGIPTLASPTAKPYVVAPDMVEELYETRGGGGVKVRLRLSSSSTNPFIEAWQFSWRLASDTVATVRNVTASPDDLLDDMAPGLYVFGARGTTRRGIAGDWSYSNPVEVFGLNATPAEITGLSAAIVSGLVTLRWTQHPDLDVRQGGLIEVRHSADMGATWQTSTSIGKAVPGSATMTTLPAISGRYLLRATDSQGVPGPVTVINTTAPEFQNLTLQAEITEGPVFAGGKVGCTVAGGALQLDEDQVFADYAFAGEMDFGSVKTARLTMRLAAQMIDRSDLFDSAELFDGTGLFEGAGDAEGDVQVYYRASTESPAVWGEWVEFDRTDVSARLLQFRAELTSISTQYRTDIVSLGVTAETT